MALLLDSLGFNIERDPVHQLAFPSNHNEFRFGLLKVELEEDCTRRHQTWLKFVQEARVSRSTSSPTYTDRFVCGSRINSSKFHKILQ